MMIGRRTVHLPRLVSPMVFAALLVSWVRSYYDNDGGAIDCRRPESDRENRSRRLNLLDVVPY